MKTIATYKKEYASAKSNSDRITTFNRAMHKLSFSDAKKFYKWQFKQTNKQHEK